MATLLDFVTNPDIIACAFLFITVMADCLHRPFVAAFETENCDLKRPCEPRSLINSNVYVTLSHAGRSVT
jgi:hypothetical protein